MLLHVTILLLLIAITVLLHPIWGWSNTLGYGPFIGSLTVLIAVAVMRSIGVI